MSRTHFKGPLIVEQTGSVIPGVVSSGEVDSLHVINDGQVDGNLNVDGNSSVGGNSSVTGNLTVTGDSSSDNASANTMAVGGGAALSFMEKGQITVTVPAIPIGNDAVAQVSVANARVGDAVVMNPNKNVNVIDPSGLGVAYVWVDADGSISLSLFNTGASGSALNGSSTLWDYCLIRS